MLQGELASHVQFSNRIRDYFKAAVNRLRSENDMLGYSKNIALIEDNMSTLLLPSLRRLFKSNEISYGDLLQLHIGGILVYSHRTSIQDETIYFPYPESVCNENANSVLTELVVVLNDLLTKLPKFDTLYLLLDRHSTGWNSYFMAFFDEICRAEILKLVVAISFDPVFLDFTLYLSCKCCFVSL